MIKDSYLSDSRVHLNNPGSQVSDLYYNKINTTVDLTECTWSYGRYKVGLTSVAFGSTGTFLIPNNGFASCIFLTLRIDNIAANNALPRGWGYAAINNINYVFGSTNVGQIQVNGESIMHMVMSQCEDVQKRSKIFNLGGQESFGAVSAAYAHVIIPLPFSGANSDYQKRPYDMTLLSSPITVNITFNPVDRFIGGTGVKPTAFNLAEITIKQGQLANSDSGLKPILRDNPESQYSYPIIHKQSFVTTATSDMTALNNVNLLLQSFIYADLVGITICAVRNSDLISSTGSVPSPFFYQVMRNVNVKYNGQVVHESADVLHMLYNMVNMPSADFFQNSIVTGNNDATFASFPADCNLLYLDFSRKREDVYDDSFSNVWRIANQTLTMTATMPAQDTQYTFFMTYYYNGIISVDSTGTSNIYFN